MLTLLKDPTQTKEVIAQLTEAQRKKPFTRSALVLQILAEKKPITKFEIWTLLYKDDISSLKELNDITKQMENMAAASEPNNKHQVEQTVAAGRVAATATATATAAAVALVIPAVTTSLSIIATPKPNTSASAGVNGAPINPNLKTRFSRLLTIMEEYINPKNAKQFDYGDFQAIVRKVLRIEGVSGEISHSKGSNTRYRVKLPNAKTLCFSYHPLHRVNSSTDTEFDPNRAQSRQAFIANLRENLLGNAKSDKAAGTATAPLPH